MSITDRKINNWTSPVVSEADKPVRSAAELKAIFDANSNQLKAALNGLVDDLVASGGAGQIGAEAIAGLAGNTVGAQLLALAASKVSSSAIKGLRIASDGYLEYTLDGTSWMKAPTWGDVTIDPGGDAKNLTVSFNEATDDENIASGETMAVLFGKLKKWFASRPQLSSAIDSDSEATVATSKAVKTVNSKATALEKRDDPITTSGTQPIYEMTDTSLSSLPDGYERTLIFHADASADASIKIIGTGGANLGTYNLYASYNKRAKPKRDQHTKVRFRNGTGFFTVSAGGGIALPDPIVAGNSVLHFNPASGYQFYAGMVGGETYQDYAYLIRTVAIPKTGIYRVYTGLNSTSPAGYMQVTRNGVAVATSGTGTGFFAINADISFNTGDVVGVVLHTRWEMVYNPFFVLSISFPDFESILSAGGF